MARAPFQVLVFPYARATDGTPWYAVFRRADLGVWQGVAGGGEDGETPEVAARREAAEEAGVPADAAWTRLDAVGRVPAAAFRDRAHWPAGLAEVPEYAFGVACAPGAVALSAEHDAVAWLPHAEAAGRLAWESNRAALAELHARLTQACSCPPNGAPQPLGTTRPTTLGLEDGAVRLVAYDSAWAALFGAEAARIGSALGPDLPLALEHMGSTAVPGLVAKPVLDVLAGYPPGSAVGPYVAALVRAGYTHRGENGIPGREFFRRGEPRAYHLHLVARGGPIWREQLAFRDALRADPVLREAYAALKRDLAHRFPRDRGSYIEGKGDFVRGVVAHALTQRALARE